MLCAIGILAITLIYVCVPEARENKGKGHATEGMSLEEIMSLEYFDIFVPADENKSLFGDVQSISFGDGVIYIMLPYETQNKEYIFYFRDKEGNYLSKAKADFSRKIEMGGYEIRLVYTTLPVMYLNVDDEKYEKMISLDTHDRMIDAKVKVCVNRTLANKRGWYRLYDGGEEGASLQGRGNITWEYGTKKSFSLRFEKGYELLGMGKNKGYNLIGNTYDPTLLKNYAFNELARKMGIRYQPKMEGINLFINGEYRGVYLLTTKVKGGKGKVALSKGDMLFCIDRPILKQPVGFAAEGWSEDEGTYHSADLVFPEEASPEELELAGRRLQKFADAVNDPNAELSKVVDLDSLARYYWIQEASMNFDPDSRSLYLYYKNGRFYMGPVWDMDLTLGSPYDQWGMDFNTPEDFRTRNIGLYKALFKHEEFKEAVRRAYFEDGIREILKGFSEVCIRYRESLSEDAIFNYNMFGKSDTGISLDYEGRGYMEYSDNMLKFYDRRIAFIDGEMSREE